MDLRLFAFLFFLEAVAGKQEEAAIENTSQEWKDGELKMCKQNLPVYYAYSCISYLWNYELINLELLNDEPPIIVYRDLVPKQYISNFITDIRDKQDLGCARRQSTSSTFESTKTKRSRANTRANATEITVAHTATEGTTLVFKRLQRFIPFIDFATSDPWQVLVFEKGGHFAPRFEYLNINSTEGQDNLTKKYGNRFASFSITLKKAEKGGDHLFPSIEKRYELEVGDGMMWHHMDATGEEEYLMAHGDCPVEIGEKITATLRLREHGQYLLLSAWPDGYYDYGMLVHPDLKFLRMTKGG